MKKRKKEWSEEGEQKRRRHSKEQRTSHQALYVYESRTNDRCSHQRRFVKALKRALPDKHSTGDHGNKGTDGHEASARNESRANKKRAGEGVTLVNRRRTPEERQKICIEKQAAELRAQVEGVRIANETGRQPILWELYSGGCSISTAFAKQNWRCFKLEIDTTLAYETGATADSIQHHYQSGGVRPLGRTSRWGIA